jgi:hypothetical protein
MKKSLGARLLLLLLLLRVCVRCMALLALSVIP